MKSVIFFTICFLLTWPGLAAAPDDPDIFKLQHQLSQLQLDKSKPFEMTPCTELILFLDQAIENCQFSLEQKAQQHLWKMRFFRKSRANKQHQQLGLVCQNVKGELEILDNGLRQLRRYIEHFPVDRWDQAFGQTGIYSHFCDLETRHKLLQGILTYYEIYPSIISSQSLSQQEKALIQLKESIDILQELRIEAPTIGVTYNPIDLWQARLLCTMAACNPQYDSAAIEFIQNRLDQSPDHEFEWLLRFEKLQLLAANSDEKAHRIDDDINFLKNLLIDHQADINAVEEKQLYLAVLEGNIRETNANSYPSDTQLQPMKDLLLRHSQLRSTLKYWVGEYLAEAFETNDDKRIINTMDDFGLMTLGEFYQNNNPPQWQLALRAYDTLLKTLSSAQPDYPAALYFKGLCHQHISRSASDNDARQSTQHRQEAIRTWHQLGSDFSHWTTNLDGQHVSSEQTMTLAASLAYQSANQEPTPEHIALANKVLTSFVGQIPAGQSQPIGSFSQTPDAQRYRYYYGLTLLASKEYSRAEDYFGSVLPQDHNKPAARYYAIRCRQLEMKNRSLTPSAQSQQLQKWIDELTQLVDSLGLLNQQPREPEIVQLGVNTVLLIGQFYLEQQSPQPEQCINLLNRYSPLWADSNVAPPARKTLFYLRANAHYLSGQYDQAITILNTHRPLDMWDAALVHVAIQSLQSQYNDLLALHAHDDKDMLIGRLSDSLSLAEFLQQFVLQNDMSGLHPIISQCHLELLAIAVVTLDNQQFIQDAQSLCLEFDNQKDVSNQLWFIRCKAMLALAQGNTLRSQELFYHIRQATKTQVDDTMKYYWWEARYYSLVCMVRQHQNEQALHIIDVLRESHASNLSPWQQRIDTLAKQLRQNDFVESPL